MCAWRVVCLCICDWISVLLDTLPLVEIVCIFMFKWKLLAQIEDNLFFCFDFVMTLNALFFVSLMSFWPVSNINRREDRDWRMNENRMRRVTQIRFTNTIHRISDLFLFHIIEIKDVSSHVCFTYLFIYIQIYIMCFAGTTFQFTGVLFILRSWLKHHDVIQHYIVFTDTLWWCWCQSSVNLSQQLQYILY